MRICTDIQPNLSTRAVPPAPHRTALIALAFLLAPAGLLPGRSQTPVPTSPGGVGRPRVRRHRPSLAPAPRPLLDRSGPGTVPGGTESAGTANAGPRIVRTVTPTAGMQLSASARLKPGTYRLVGDTAGAIQVTGQNVVLDCTGVRLEGTGKGVGLRIFGAAGVTIRGLNLSGYQWGVVVEKSSGVYLQDCVASRNADLPAGTVIDESGRLPEDTHGGGFLLRDCQHCRVLGCVAEHEWDGLDVVRCRNNTFRDNEFSFLNNWGLHLWDSSHNTFAHNRCIWCTTGEGRTYQGIGGWQTYDAEAVCMEHGSSYNLIDGNDLRYGGDGVYIRANEGPATPGSPVPPLHPSNHNVVSNNDCSFSPNNAIEADFCDDNQFHRNNCSMSNYGFWLGYSRRAIVTQNTVVGCSTRAIEIENGQDDRIESNTFVNRADATTQSLVLLRQNGHDKTPSGPYRLLNNVFVGSIAPVRLMHTQLTAGGNRLVTSSNPIVFADNDSTVTTIGAVGNSTTPRPQVARMIPALVALGSESPAARSRIHVPLAPATADFALPAYQTLVTAIGTRISTEPTDPVVEVGGIPAMVVRSSPSRVTFVIPDDFWDHAVLASTLVKIFNGENYSAPTSLRLSWPSSRPRLEAITPSNVPPDTSVTVVGEHLLRGDGSAPAVLLDGNPVRVTGSTPNSVTFTAPRGLLTTHHYNLVVRSAVESAPLTFTVTVPQNWEPHVTAAHFSPTALPVGQLLHFTATVKNNAPFTLAAADPGAGHVYGEKESYETQGIPEKFGVVYVRVTSDVVGGGWPYLFGLPRPLAPGESETVEGDIRVETPGQTIYRVGLVDGRVRFIDNNLFATPVTVE